MQKGVTVFTNDPKNPQLGFAIGGNVEEFATISPRFVRLMGRAGESIKATVTIIPAEKYPFRIIEAKAQSGAHINLELSEEQNPPNRKFRLTIENTKREKGRYYDVVYLTTDSKLNPQIKVSVYGKIADSMPKGNT